MKLSRKWLSDFTDIKASNKEYSDAMTLSGSKVESIEVLGAEISNVVVGKVLTIERHPDSDHLWICSVDVGEEAPIQIVTGAQNVKVGDLVPVALHGSTLPGGVKIKKGNLRGVKSEGMLCSLKELDLDKNDFPYAEEDGIFILQEDCKPGDDIKSVIGFDDTVFEFEITNNRPDCFSIIGLARESAVTFGTELKLKTPKVKGSGGNILDYIDVEIEDSFLCPRYTARVVKNIKIEPSPKWMRQRLRACGVRPINNIVDITNYVMLEYGQPMHAFDYSCIEGNRIIVRTARVGETLETLDGNLRKLTTDMLMIADEYRPIGIAGVMGGANSEITDKTTTVVFESANFNGVSIRRTATALGMRTDASSRFEKGLDPLMTLPAVERACELVEMLGAGEVVDGVVDVIAADIKTVTLPLEKGKINALLGTDIPEELMVKVLTDLGFTVKNGIIAVPSWRSDIEHYSDIAEEIARFYGYNVIEPTVFKGAAVEGGLTARQAAERSLGELCRGIGFTEILTYSFIGDSDYDKLRIPKDSSLRRSLKILNPLGDDTSLMRTTGLPSMLEVLGRNSSYRNREVRLYELAKVYNPVDGAILPDERTKLVLGAYGESEDFFTLKGCVEAILKSQRITEPEFAAVSDNPSFHPGRCAEISFGGRVLGIMGQIHPKVQDNYGIDMPVYVAELDLETIFESKGPEPSYRPLPRYPSVYRDLAIVCDSDTPVAVISKVIKEAGGKLLKEVRLFDIYTGSPIPEGKKSAAFSLEFRSDEQNLTDAEVNPPIDKILKQLNEELGAQIR
jgi:phenylalanyl-tRNA synthetase beta chain